MAKEIQHDRRRTTRELGTCTTPQDVLNFITCSGGNPDHYIIDDEALYWKVYDDTSWQTGTDRQIDINKRIVEGILHIDEGFNELDASIDITTGQELVQNHHFKSRPGCLEDAVVHRRLV